MGIYDVVTFKCTKCKKTWVISNADSLSEMMDELSFTPMGEFPIQKCAKMTHRECGGAVKSDKELKFSVKVKGDNYQYILED